MQAQLYSKIKVYINGSLLTEEAEVKLTRNSALLPVNTVNKGWAGFAVGAPSIEIEVTNAVPDAGFEYNSGPDQIGANFVQICLQAAGKSLVSNGGIMGDDLSHAVNSESKMSLRFHGEWADFI